MIMDEKEITSSAYGLSQSLIDDKFHRRLVEELEVMYPGGISHLDKICLLFHFKDSVEWAVLYAVAELEIKRIENDNQ